MAKLVIDPVGSGTSKIAIGIVANNHEDLLRTYYSLFNSNITDSELDERTETFGIVWSTEERWISKMAFKWQSRAKELPEIRAMVTKAQETGLSKQFKKNASGFFQALAQLAFNMIPHETLVGMQERRLLAAE